jgi:Mg-chelatase subunit ChlD
MRPIATGVDVKEIHDFEDQTIYRQPLDVVFVIDESGSMNDYAASGDKKYIEARKSVRTFLGELNESRDRAAIVGFEAETDKPRGKIRFHLTDGNYFSNDFDQINTSTLNEIQPRGGTSINGGMREGSTLLDLKSNDSRKKVVIVLTDGKNDVDSSPGGSGDYTYSFNGGTITMDEASVYWADQAAENGADVYTVGFASSASAVNSTVLKNMTYSSDGRYYFADNGTSLKDVFKDIAREVTSTEAIARPPVSVNVTTANSSFYPQISGNTSYVANGTGTNNSEVLNVNDPTAPEFSFALTVPDGENVSMTALSYSCDRWEATSQTVVNSSVNETYIVTRCAQLNESSEERLQPSNVSVYTDGDNVSALVNQREAWFQGDLNQSLQPYMNGTNLTLPSNQAVVVFDYKDDDKADKRIVMLLQMGYAESQRSTDSVVQMRVNNVTVKD